MELSRFLPNLVLYYIFLTLINNGSTSNICKNDNYTVINDSRRSTRNIFNASSGDALLCDRGFIMESVWYRFETAYGNQLATSKPENNHCGTYTPIWMNGVHPTVNEGVVLRKACANIPFAPPLGCGDSYDIKVLNCSGFYVYQLKPPDKCYLAYCVASNQSKATSPDINECLKIPSVCHPHANCTNVVGSFSCRCRDGYSGDGKMNCTDTDECHQSPCHPLASCSNTVGSYLCQCRNGSTGDGHMSCTDINECEQPASVCHPHANCINVVGSFSCQCRDGYSGDGKMNCTDIDECHQSPCHPLASCSNTVGSYLCRCRNGYTGDGHLSCTDINDCEYPTSVCHPQAYCLNTQGSFLCRCMEGFTKNGAFNCTVCWLPE